MTLKLQFPVHTLNRRRLLPAGARLTKKTLKELADAGKKAGRTPVSLMGYGTVRRDLRGFLRQDTYRAIFDDPRNNASLFDLMEKVRLDRTVLSALAYFRKNDGYTYRHVLRVFALSAFLSRSLTSNFEERVLDAAAGPLHDLGKICVPLRILRKTTPLRRSERMRLEHHVCAGYALLCHHLGDPAKPAARVALQHHERRDGSGYPRGIPLRDRLVEIVAVCDVYDALISPRPYRKESYDNRTALEEITDMAIRGKLDWEIVKVLVAHHRKGRPDPLDCEVSVEKRGRPPANNLYGVLLEDELTPDADPE